jgi:hypothetical protein
MKLLCIISLLFSFSALAVVGKADPMSITVNSEMRKNIKFELGSNLYLSQMIAADEKDKTEKKFLVTMLCNSKSKSEFSKCEAIEIQKLQNK